MLVSYILKHKDEEIRAASRSGGIFTALSDWVLKQGGIVYGCCLDENFKAHHIRAVTEEERNLCRGSKYTQSDLGNILGCVLDDLKRGKLVLFSGTSCQVAGVKSLCNNYREKLICVDIVCHGVPSPMVWKDYLDFSERRYKGTVTGVEFINKNKYGWSAHYETITVDGKDHDGKIFTQLFAAHDILRPACYECPYKQLDHPGDITIGDAWGVQNQNPDFNDNKGVSLVLVNSKKGEELFSYVKDTCDYIQIGMDGYMQTPLVRPYKKPDSRESFWNYYHSHTFEQVVSRYIELNIFRKAIRKAKRITNR